MKCTKGIAVITLAAGFGLAGLAQAQDGTTPETKKLAIGDKAPEIDVAHWVRGEPVTTFEKDQVYIVEFWATWCGPCRASIPHIASLQEKYEEYNVKFVGLSDEDLPTVVNFLASTPEGEESNWYEKMAYTVGADADRSVYTDYMKAADQRGIPTAFIVGKTGEVEWIGHPMTIDEPLDKVVHDNWDREAYQAEFALKAKLNEFYQSGEYDKAVATIDEYLKKYESESLEMAKFQLLLGPLDREAEAYAMGERILKLNWDNAMGLNMISWNILTDEEIEERDYDFAMKAAERACELTDWKDGAILDTLARAYYETGDLTNAIKWQKQAVESAENESWKKEFQVALEKYEKEAGENN